VFVFFWQDAFDVYEQLLLLGHTRRELLYDRTFSKERLIFPYAENFFAIAGRPAKKQ
jgi:hypothetical protein